MQSGSSRGVLSWSKMRSFELVWSAPLPSPINTVRSREIGIAALLGLGWLITIALVDPRGEFPSVDDWAYRFSVDKLVEHGQLVYSNWAAANFLTHFAWGALFTKLFGSSYVVLRISSIVALGLSALMVYQIVRANGANFAAGLIAAATLLFDPLAYSLAFTFMSDLTFCAALLLAIYGISRYENGGGRGVGVIGWTAAVAALLCRQTGLAIPIGYALALLYRRRRAIDWIKAALAITAFIAIQSLFGHYLNWSGKAPVSFGRQSDEMIRILFHEPDHAINLSLLMLAYCFQYLGFLCLPVTILALSPAIRRLFHNHHFSWMIATILSGVIIGFIMSRFWMARFPMWNNTISIYGIGPSVSGALTPWRIVTALTMVSAMGGVMLLVTFIAGVRFVIDRARDQRHFDVGLFSAAIGIVLVGAMMTIAMRFDRYLIPVLACVIVSLAGSFKSVRIPGAAMIASSASIALFAVGSTLATHDAVNGQRAQWRAYEQLRRDVPVETINGGFVLNGYAVFDRLAKDDERLRRYTEFGYFDDEYLVEVAREPKAGYEEKWRVPVDRWLPWGRDSASVLVQRRRH